MPGRTPRRRTGHQPLPVRWPGAIGGVRPIHPDCHHHVEPVLKQPADQAARTRGIVGRVPVHQHVDIGLHIGEHAAHDVALALVRFPAHHRAGRAATSTVLSVELLS